jgi:hypothetical protein
MDVPTRIGLGGTALFTAAGFLQPLFGWWVSGPIMAFCALVAGWGFYPLVRDFPWISKKAQNRISMVELLTLATSRGWDFSDSSLHLLDMQEAVRQGASDEELLVWGKPRKWNDERLMQQELSVKIPSDHWKKYFIDLFPARMGKNFDTKSWSPETQDPGFIDLHVTASTVRKWLKGDAEAFKGKTQPRGGHRS